MQGIQQQYPEIEGHKPEVFVPFLVFVDELVVTLYG